MVTILKETPNHISGSCQFLASIYPVSYKNRHLIIQTSIVYHLLFIHFHKHVLFFWLQWQGDGEVFNVELRQILRHRTLLAELQHADENMQLLR